jgi:hypothetical protein
MNGLLLQFGKIVQENLHWEGATCIMCLSAFERALKESCTKDLEALKAP